MTVYKSKIGYEVLIPIILLLGITFYLHIVNKVWLGIIINSLISFLITYLITQTKYIITGNILIIKAGFMINKTISIQEIKCITRTNNPLSSPALSLDRIEILYAKMKRVVISPKDRNLFINQLQAINNDIKYFEKK
jgi:hypothetical protein